MQLKLAIDTGHMLFAGGDSVKIAKDYGERLIHIHCKDMRENILKKSLKEDLSFRHAFLEGAFTVPGDGCIDYKPFLQILKNINYSGWLVVEAEQDPKKQIHLNMLRKVLNIYQKQQKIVAYQLIISGR